MDVKTTFLHGDLEEEVYMTQPEHFVVKGKSHLVCKLKKSLYGLKRSLRMWYQKFDTYVLNLGFVRSKSNHCIYYKSDGDYFLVIALYVDDMLFIGKGKCLIAKLKAQLSAKFEMKDLGVEKNILGMEIIRDRQNRKLWLGQSKYVGNILRRINIQDSRPLSVHVTLGTNFSSSQCPSSPLEMEEMSQVPY